jgi:hypothetical protein
LNRRAGWRIETYIYQDPFQVVRPLIEIPRFTLLALEPLAQTLLCLLETYPVEGGSHCLRLSHDLDLFIIHGNLSQAVADGAQGESQDISTDC